MARTQQRHADQLYDFFCVLDFEATCDTDGPPQPQEIIEFPVVLLDARTLEVKDVFHQFVRPEHHPQLTEFCKNLTGISQAQVDAGVSFTRCLELLQQWLVANGLEAEGAPGRSWLSVSCGVWDHRTMLPAQCTASRVSLPACFRRACDVTKVFREVTGKKRPESMAAMLATLGLEPEGRLHSGIDDARNIARIVRALVQRGAVMRPNWRVTPVVAPPPPAV